MVKKLTLIILGAVIMNIAITFVPLFNMEAYGVTGNIDLENAEFKVTTNLKLPNADGKVEQKSSYFFQTGEVTGMSPIVFFIMKVIEFATKIMGSIAVILYIVAGFMFMASQGNQQDLDKAKEVFKYTTIGLIVAFSSYLITLFVQSIFYTSAG